MSMDLLRRLATCGSRRRFEQDTLLVGQEGSQEYLLVILEGKVSITINVGVERTVWPAFGVAGSGERCEIQTLAAKAPTTMPAAAATPIRK